MRRVQKIFHQYLERYICERKGSIFQELWDGSSLPEGPTMGIVATQLENLTALGVGRSQCGRGQVTSLLTARYYFNRQQNPSGTPKRMAHANYLCDLVNTITFRSSLNSRQFCVQRILSQA